MKHSEVLSRYVNTGEEIPEEQYDRLTPVLKKSYLRMRSVAGYERWEFKVLSDNQRIYYIETKRDELDKYGFNDSTELILYSDNKDNIITKIIEIKGEKLKYNHILLILVFAKDKELIKKTLLQNGVDYKLINKVISDTSDKAKYEYTPLIPDNYQSMLQEIRRIKEIMI